MIKSAITFSHVDFKSDTLKSRENQDTLLQWNLLECLSVERYLFSGPFHDDASQEYDRLLNDFFYCSDCHVGASLSSSSQLANSIDSELLNTSVMTMEFFDRLLVSDILASSGYIRGCFDEIYDGITVSDKLRDFLINEQSDNATMYDVEDRRQFIFAIFKLFAVGGSMCQPDSKIQRYLDMTKQFYKELITVYRQSKDDEIKVSGRVYRINSVAGQNLFSHPESPHNNLFVIVDPVKKLLTVIKNDFRPYW